MARYENTRNKDRYVGTWRLQRQELAASAPAAEATSLAP
jgi:hypothetical protein